MTTNLLTKGNITTLATWIAIGITTLVAVFGVELDLTPYIPLIAGLITIGIAVYSSKHPNTFAFLGNDGEAVTVNVDTEMLAETIQDLMDKYNANSTVDVEIEEADDEDGDGI